MTTPRPARSCRFREAVIGVLSIAFVASTAAAAAASAPQTETGTTGVQCDDSKLQVTKAIVAGAATDSGSASAASGGPEVHRGDTLVVSISDPDKVFSQAACRDKRLVLYLNGQAIPDGVGVGGEGSSRTVSFTLQPTATDSSRATWAALLARPNFESRSFQVNAGLDGGKAFAPAPGEKPVKIRFQILDRARVWAWAVLVLLLVIAFFVLAAKTELLRAGPLPDAGARRPFSLSRTQAAWWLFIILGTYLLIGLVTGDYLASLNSTALVLLGISAGAAVGAATVDSAQQDAAAQVGRVDAIARAQSEVAAAQATMPAADQAAAPAAGSAAGGGADDAGRAAAARGSLDASARLADKVSRLKAARNETETFWVDILSDADGVTVHRFQNVVWTVVLGIVFAAETWTHLSMPVFDNTLLALTGISAATYVGMKIPEAKVPTTAAG